MSVPVKTRRRMPVAMVKPVSLCFYYTKVLRRIIRGIAVLIWAWKETVSSVVKVVLMRITPLKGTITVTVDQLLANGNLHVVGENKLR